MAPQSTWPLSTSSEIGSNELPGVTTRREWEDRQPSISADDLPVGVLMQAAANHEFAKWSLEEPLYRAPQFPGAIGRAEARLGQVLPRFRGDVQRDPVLKLQGLTDLVEHRLQDLLDGALVEAVKRHHLINAIDELGAKGLAQTFEVFRTHTFGLILPESQSCRR